MANKKKFVDDVLVIAKVERELKDEFMQLCTELDTTASRELRMFIRTFVETRTPKHRQVA